MSDNEPPSRDGPSDHHPRSNQHKTAGGSLARLRTLLRLFMRPRGARGSPEAMEALIEVASLEGDTPISPQERFLIGNILNVHDITAADVMVPRVDIVALDADEPFSEVVK